MRVRCHLARFRGDRTQSELAAAAGVSQGVVSLIEHGRMLPTDAQVPRLEDAYGVPKHLWYPIEVAIVLELDSDDERDRERARGE